MDSYPPTLVSPVAAPSETALLPSAPADSRWALFVDRLPLRYAQLHTVPRVLRNLIRQELEPKIHHNLDFGNIRNKGQQQTRVATNAAQVQHLLRQANESGQTIHVAAGRHSSNGHTLAPKGGLQLQLDPAAWGKGKWVSDTQLELPGCMRWREAEALAQRAGRSIPVLTDHLGTTVGGTLSVGGGIGCRSVVGGRQIDHISALRLITPTGDARWVTPESDQELFSLVLGAQGTLGIIDRVLTDTVPYFPYTTEFKLQFRSLADAAIAAENFCNRSDNPDSFCRLDFVGPLLNTKVVELSLGFEFKSREQAKAFCTQPCEGIVEHKARIVAREVVRDMAHHNNARSSAYISTLTTPGNRHRFFWNDYLFPGIQEYLAFLQHLQEEHFPRLGNQYLMAGLGLCYPKAPAQLDFPFSGLRRNQGERPWSIGLNYAVPETLEGVCGKTARSLDALQTRCHQLGGRVYRYGYSNAQREELQAIYQEDYSRLRALKAKLDPKRILNPGVLGL